MADQYRTYRESSTPPQCALPAYEGWVEFATCDWISGWAADRGEKLEKILYGSNGTLILALAHYRQTKFETR